NVLQRHRISPGLTVGPSRLNRRTEGCAFPDFKSHHRQPKNVRHDLAHSRTFGPTTGDAQFISANCEVDEAFHSLSKSNNDSFNQGAGNIVAIAVGGIQAVNHPAAVW